MTEINQSPDISIDANAIDEDNLFADYDPAKNGDTPDTTEVEDNQPSEIETESNEEVEEKTDQQDAMTHDQPAFLKIKYNKEDKELTEEEAVTLAQKGMNYDNILEKYNSLKDNEAALKEVTRLAQANNMSVEEYIRGWTELQNKFELDNEIKSLKEMYPNTDDAALEEIAKYHMNDKANLISKRQQESEQAKKQEISRQMDVFSKRYPNVDPSKLEQGVYALMREGYTLLEAYESVAADKRQQESIVKESQEKAQKLNEENKAKSIGNVTNTKVNDENSAFLDGLFSLQ